jgi:quinol monooxygenase YgiN
MLHQVHVRKYQISVDRTIHAMAKQLTLIVNIRVKPEDAEKLVDAHRPIWASCANEPECLFFDVFQDPEDKGKFRFIEVWSKSRKWFEDVQFKRSYYDRLWQLSKPLWIEEGKYYRLGGPI